MNKHIFFIVVYIFTNLLIINAQSFDSLFVNMPNEYNPVLSKKNRLELIESFKLHRSDSIINRFGNRSIVIRYDSINKLIVIKNTFISQFEMKQIEIKGIEAICLILTVSKPISNSYIEFYTKNWEKLPFTFNYPKSKDWLITEKIKNDSIDPQWLQNIVDINFISMTFSEVNNNILITNNLLDFLSHDDKLLVETFISNKPIVYEYKNQFWQKSSEL